MRYQEFQSLQRYSYKISRAFDVREQDLDDVFQQSLVKFLTAYPENNLSCCYPLFKRILINSCVDWTRLLSKRVTTPLEECVWFEDVIDHSQDSENIDKQLDSEATISKLQFEKQDKALVLHSCGCTYPEIAVCLKLPLGTVRSRIHLSRKRLIKQCLKKSITTSLSNSH